jgi:hypothetical protein
LKLPAARAEVSCVHRLAQVAAVGAQHDVVRPLLVIQLDQARGMTGDLGGFRDYGANKLAAERDLVGIKDRGFRVTGPG